MNVQLTPWDPVETSEDEELPFMSLLAEARAALDAPGATVTDIKRKYRRAINRGSAHLESPTIETVANELAKAVIVSNDYDDGPFEEQTVSEFVPKQRRPTRRPRPMPPAAPQPTAMDRMLKLLGR